MSTVATPVEVGAGLDELDQFLLDHHLEGSWMRQHPREHPLPKPAPLTGYKALGWKWAQMRAGLLKAGDLVGIGPGGLTEMRTVRGEGAGKTAVYMDAQVLMPGEHTRAHFNMKNETRLVNEAPKGAVFVCDGEAFPMERGDLIISPSWSFHDHFNGGDTPAVWVDGFDTGYSGLGAELNTRLPESAPYQEIKRTDDFSLKTLGRVQLAVNRPDMTKPRPAIRYPYAETTAALAALRNSENEPDPFEGFHLMFISPTDGGPTLPTFAWHVQVLPSHFETGVHRHNSTTCYQAFEGDGRTTIEGESIEWSAGDLFVVPPWTWHSHHNASANDALLFSIDDWPARTKLGFYCKEEKNESAI